MRTDPSGARWCVDHGRWECAKAAKRAPVCHGIRIVGLDRCRMHAGQSRELAKFRGEAAQKAVTFGLPRDIDPAAALLEEVHRTAGHVAWLQARVAELGPDDLVWNLTEEVDKQAAEFTGTDTTRKAVPHVFVTMYQQERKHLAAVCKAAIDAGVSERIVQVYEQVGGMFAGLLDRVLDRLDLNASQRVLVPGVVQAELQAIAQAGERR